MLAVLASLERPLFASYTQIFMVATGDFIVQYFPVFLLGAIFGKLMEDSGSAQVLADATIRRLGSERAILALVLSYAAMTMAGCRCSSSRSQCFRWLPHCSAAPTCLSG
jgi:H+/gluconate symporter-like permease